MADSKNMVIKIVSDAKDFVKGMEDALRQIQSASQKAQNFDKIAEDAANLKEQLSKVAENLTKVESAAEAGSTVTDAQIEKLQNNFENLNKKFDSFRHTFGDMQEKLNGLSTRTLQVQLDKANDSLKAFRENYSSWQREISAGLSINKNLNEISNIYEMKKAYEDSLNVYKNFSETRKKNANGDFSKEYLQAAANVYKYGDALIELNSLYNKNNKGKPPLINGDSLDKIDDKLLDTGEIIGREIASKIENEVESSLGNIDINTFFKKITGQVKAENLMGVYKGGSIEIPVKIDPKAFSNLENEINKDISALQSRANDNPIKIYYETNTEDLSKNIEKYFNELNTKLKNQVAELNTLMQSLVDDTGLKKTEQDFSSIAKLIPEMLRKVAEYSEQLKTITTDTKTSFENVNSFVKEENFINYANAIKQTAESFKLLTSSLDDVSSKLSGNGLEGQFDLLKKKFSEISVDSLLNKENTKEIEAAKKAKIIKELFALYSTYQSRGGIRPFSDLISGEADANKKAYIQLAYNDYAKNKNKKGTSTEPVPFDAKQLKDILQILKEIKETIKSISETKIDTSELAEAISKIQGNNNEPIFTPQNVAQIWQVLIQYANNYSESLEKVIGKLEIISEKDFNSNNIQQTYEQIENIIQLLRKGFDIPSLDQLNTYFDNIKNKYNSLLSDKGTLDLRKKKEELKSIFKLYYDYQKMGGEKDISILTDNKKDKQKLDTEYKKYLNTQIIDEEDLSKANNYNDLLKKIIEEISLLNTKKTEPIKFDFGNLENYYNLFQNLVGSLQEALTLFKQINNIPQKINTGIEYTGDPKDSLKVLTELEKRMPPVEEGFSRIIHMTSLPNSQSILNEGLAMTSDITQHSLFMQQYIKDAENLAKGLELSFNTLGILSGKFGDVAVVMDIPTEEVKGYSNAISGLDSVSTNYIRGTLNLSQSLITLNENFGKSTTTIEAFAKAIYEAKQNEENLQNNVKDTNSISPALPRSSQLTNTANRIFGEQQFSQYYSQYEKTQKEINDVNNNSVITFQNIVDAIDRVKNSLNDIIGMLEALSTEIANISNNNSTIDYSNRISNIKRGITELNKSVQQLNERFDKLDFDKINNIKISTEPFDKIIKSLKEIIDLTERISGVPSKSSLESQFKDIQKIYSSLVNDKGNFIVTKNKDAVQNLFSQYSKYLKFGGTKTLTDLGDSKANVNKLSKYYNKYLDDISQQNESEVSTTSSIKNEAQNFIDIRDAANEATASKESFIKANKKLETQTDKTSKSLEQEKTQFKTFINDVKTLVTTDIESNNVVDFNTQILDSAKQTNEALKEELQHLQKLNEIQKTNPIKQNNIPVISRNDSSKKQDSKKRISSFEKSDSEFDYEDLGLSYDPYLTAFQEFLLIAAEEAEKVKQQIISVAEFDNRLSEALTALYGQIPDLDDISASTGYGKNFNVTGATVSFRDKTTNDIYRKTFSLKKDKETGNFYIDQTTAILNDAEKYGKDNEKQAQKVLEWQTKLNAWLQSFSNKTSGTLDSTKDFQTLKNFNFSSEKDWVNIKTIQQRLEGLYNEIVLNSTKGTSSLRPVPNMIYGQESRQTKKEKAESIYNRMALNWNGENGAEDTESELKKLSSLYDNLQIEIKKFNEDGSNIESVAQAYGTFNEQLNKVNEQLNRMKIINTEINGNKINNLNNWFKDMPDPNSAEGKIEKYGQVYGQFVETQQRLNELTTNLNRGTTEEDAQEYENKKEKIHELVLELEEFKKILSSDSMNINNQMGQVIKQNIPETENIEELRKVINEYAGTKGKIIDVSETGATIDKEGNEFVTFTRKIQDTKGAVTEFEFTYNKAMGTVAVATKKIQEPESAFKALADELTTKWRGLFTTLASFTGFYRLWGYFKQGISTIREFDTALTEMQKVSDETITTLQQYQSTTFDTADAIGATALQIQNSTADFMRLGESLKEAAESAKVANVLMNVSEFQSIDEATKSLIAMSAAYDDLSKMNIIDKLNEVGNNYAISTSEAATALQNSASALKTANNDMDEALALITAGNAVVQDANKVGTGMRTIALRLTGTKSAKEQLEELGEETENVITTQSKLRDTIKEATAVASNNFKGFDILNDNGNYKSTYEIMLGIADVYDEILETDKQFGRNNANLLLENVAGKTRANIAASIFQNPQLLRDAYKSSQEAENSAMEENEKYMDSINGHIAQLQNAYQQMWANSMNRDTINYFIDLGKSILKVVDSVGLLGTAFTVITGVKSIVGYQNGKGFAYEIITGSKNAIKALAQTDGAMGTLASKAISVGQTIKGSFSSAIPVIGGIASAISLAIVGINAYIQHQEQIKKEQLDIAKTTGETFLNNQDSINQNIARYEELQTKMREGNLTEQEQIQTKEEILNIQRSINDSYSGQVQGVDLVNGELEKQKAILDEIANIEAKRVWESSDFQEGFEIASEAMTKANNFTIRSFRNGQDEVDELLKKYADLQPNTAIDESGNGANVFEFAFGSEDIYEAKNKIEAAIDEVEQYRQQHLGDESAIEYADTMLAQLRGQAGIIEKTIQDYAQTYLQGLEIELKANLNVENVRGITNLDGSQMTGYQIYQDYQSAINNLESAYASGNTKNIDEARDAFEKLNDTKERFLNTGNNNQFRALFNQISTSTIDAKNRVEDLRDVLELVPQSIIESYDKAKAEGDKAYKQLGEFQKVGNVDNGDRPFIFWDDKEIKKQEKAIKSWGETAENMKGSFSTVFGGSGKFDGVEIAFTPVIKGTNGEGQLLSKETLYKYIDSLISEAGEGWTNEKLFALDAEGMAVDGIQISNVIADIGDTAAETGEKMHDWQSEAIGYIGDFKDIYLEALEQGMTLDEFMSNQPRLYKKNARAADKYANSTEDIYIYAKRVKDLNLDRVDVASVFESGASSSADYADAIYDAMNAMGYAENESSVFIDDLVALGLIQGDITDALNTASVSYNDYANAISTATENLSILQNVLTESDSGKGLTDSTLDQFKKAFGDDAVKALEKTANGIRVNRDAVRELGEQQDASLRTTHLEALNDQYTALQRVYEGYENALRNGESTTPFLQQEEAIKNEIANLELLQAEWRGTTSAYQSWLNAESNSNPQDMYSSILKGYETVENLFAHGWWTDESVRAYLDLVSEDSFDAWSAGAEELKEKFDSLDETIEGTSYSIRDFMYIGDDGMVTTTGLDNFEKALVQKQKELGKEWVTYNENDEAVFDFTNGGNLEVANALGIGTEFLDAIIAAMESAGGYEVKLDTDDATKNLETLKQDAIEAKETLNLNEKINLDPSNVEEADKSINNLNQVIESIQNDNTIDLETKTDKLKEANKILEYLVENKNQLVQSQFSNGEITLIDVSALEAADKQLQKIINRPIKGGFDFSEFDFETVEGLEAAKNAINGMLISPNIDDSQVQYLNELLDTVQQKLDILNGVEGGTELTFGQYKALDETVTSIKEQIEEGQAAAARGFNISWSSDEEFVTMLDTLNNLDPEIKSKFGLIPDKTTEELIDMVEHGETIFVETKTKGATPAPVQDEERTVTTTENVTLGVTTIGADYANEALQQFESKDGQVYNVSIDAQANTKEANAELEETTSKGEEFGKMQPESKLKTDNSQSKNAIDEARASMNNFNGTTAWGYIRIDAGDSKSTITTISNAIRDMPTYKKVTVETVEKTTKVGGANGTAHFRGTAFSRGSVISGNALAGGNWGVPKNETALTGELGTEIVVRNGNWFTIGDNGAEFVNLKKGDIVFNHKQSEELLENGYVTSNKGRGHLVGFADGTAFYRGTMLSGSAYGDRATRGSTKVTVSEHKVGSTTSTKTSSTKGSSSNNGNGGNNDNHGNNNNNNNTDKKAKETKNTLDEVEILIARIERQISNLDKTIGKTYLSWTSRNKAIKTNLAKVSKEIKDQNQAYTTYMKKANSIQITTSSKKTAEEKKKESEAWKAKIKNGKFKIEDVKDSDLWDKINEYKQWYEKALAAKDAIADLTSKEAELYKQRFDNEQTYFENLIGQIEHSSTVASTLADTLEENGQLASKVFVFKQRDEEQARLRRLQQEYNNLIKRRDEAVKAGKIKKGSEMWYEMQESINGVCESIKEAEKNIVSYNNTARQIDWDRWDRIHDAIGGVNNELEFLYDLLDEDKMFDEEGTITNQGITAFALLAQQYDTYFKEVQKYQNEIDATQKQLNEDPYNQNLVDKLKDLKEAQQDAASNAKKMKDSMVDVTEKGIKKQIDYVKKLIDDYEDLLETQKDQTEYAKKVADQQKEINKLEKQYRAIQNDNSEEGATKRQRLRDQIEEKRQSLQETQEDRRLSETKDMLSKFEENFEEFLNNKLNNVEKIVQDVITATNNNRDTIKNTINEVSKAYGYTPSSTLQSAIDDMSKKLVSYFNSQGKFTSTDVSTITEGVNAIVKYFADAQALSETTATQQVAEENITHNGGTGTAVTNAKGERTIVDKNGKLKNGFYTQNGKTYYAKNGEQLKGQWLTLNNKKYYLDSTGARVTGNKYINGRYYQFDKNGVLQKKSDKAVRAEVIKSSGTHMLAYQDAKGNTVQGYYDDKGVLDTDHTGWAKKGGKIYRFENGKQVTSKWVTSNGKKYYVRKDGTRASGFVTINGKTYYFADSSWKGYKSALDGQMLTGFKTIGKYKYYFGNNGVMSKNAWQTIGKKKYYFNASGHAVTGKQTINKVKYTFNDDGSLKKKGWKKGTASVPTTDWAWTNEGRKPEAIIRKSDGAILTPLSKGDSVIPNNAMKNMYQALTDPAKYLKQYTMPDVKVIQSTGNNNSSPIVNMQFIANGVQDANKFANELMNNKKLEKWIQEVTLGQANGNNSFRKYNYAIR